MKVQTSFIAFLFRCASTLISRKPRPRRASLLLVPDAVIDQAKREFVVPLGDTVTVTVIPRLWWSLIEVRGDNVPHEAPVVCWGLPKNEAGDWKNAVLWYQFNLKFRAFENSSSYWRKRQWQSLEDELRSLLLEHPIPDETIEADKVLKALKLISKDVADHAAKRNERFVQKRLAEYEEFFSHIEADPLSAEQRRACIVDDDHVLLVAGAGSGKTSVVAAKVGYLIESESLTPQDFVLLSFAKDASTEITERLAKCLSSNKHPYFERFRGLPLQASTFHKLGFALYRRSLPLGDKVRLVGAEEKDQDTNERSNVPLLESIVHKVFDDPASADAAYDFLIEHFRPARTKVEFSSCEEYASYMRASGVRRALCSPAGAGSSRKGVDVNSYEEFEIANFLFIHGVDFKYEEIYESNDLVEFEPGFHSYHPDFSIYQDGRRYYLEHFGLDVNGEPPPFFSAGEKARYKKGVEWKFNVHKRFSTPLLTTYSYQKTQGRLLAELRKQLERHGIRMKRRPFSEIQPVLNDIGLHRNLADLVSRFITQHKCNALTIGELTEKARTQEPRAVSFVKFYAYVFRRYQTYLKKKGLIDFNDMILGGIKALREGTVNHPCKVVVVDEFQDIAPGRAELVKALLAANPGARLFVVGDDFQAIYRFAGCDLDYFLNFGKHFSPHDELELKTVYRFDNQMCDASTRFVLKNVKGQRNKQLSAFRNSQARPAITVVQHGSKQDTYGGAAERIFNDIVQREEFVPYREAPHRKLTITVLSRYKKVSLRDKALKQAGEDFALRFPSVEFQWMTVHASKGLGSDYVVVLDLEDRTLGFPCQIEDDPLLKLVLSSEDTFPYAEERRLFYVALTRTKRHCYLMASSTEPSDFIQELVRETDFNVEIFSPVEEEAAELSPFSVGCSRCKVGKMSAPSSIDNPRFLSCSNWRLCKERFYRCSDRCDGWAMRKAGDAYECGTCGAIYEDCPNCGGMLNEQKIGDRKPFTGCQNFFVPQIKCRYKKWFSF